MIRNVFWAANQHSRIISESLISLFNCRLSIICICVSVSLRDVLSGWGSGTGAAGVAGAFLYSAFTQAGLTPQVTLWIMLVVPVILAVRSAELSQLSGVAPVKKIHCINIYFPLVISFSYFFLLVFPSSFPQWRRHEDGHSTSREVNSQVRRPLIEEETDTDEDTETTQEEQGVYSEELVACIVAAFHARDDVYDNPFR